MTTAAHEDETNNETELYRSGAAQAVDALERALARDPWSASDWRRLAHLQAQAGDAAKAAAAAQRASTLETLPPALVEAGRLISQGQARAGEAQLQAFVAAQGEHVEALRLLAACAARRGERERAEHLLDRALALDPDHAPARLDLARALIARRRYPAALARLDERPSGAEADFLRATALAGLGRHAQAADLFARLLARAPQEDRLRLLLGHSLRALGRTAQAVALYRAASAGRAVPGDAFWALANLKTYRFGDDEIERMRALASSPQVCFALGKAYEDRDDFARAWESYSRGNALARSALPYNRATAESEARRLAQTFTRGFFAAREGYGAPDRDPIFIVGLPRSGSTLVEQILAAHPDIDATQELQDVPRLVAAFNGPRRDAYPERLADLPPETFADAGRRYLADTRPYRAGRPRFVDKMPNNFWHVGFIHLMLPNAKVIDVRRAPLACCVSNLKQYYAQGHAFSYGVEDVAHYYRIYVDLMRHWDDALPGRVLRLAYEDIVEDLEGSVRRLLDHCEVAFDPACLDFHRSRRAVATPSSEQVRRPIFRDGVEGWRGFAPWLGPLRAALGPLQ